jgi:hypothetical protein
MKVQRNSLNSDFALPFKDFPGISSFNRYPDSGIPVPPCLFCLSAVMAMHIILKFKHNEIKIVQKQQRRKKQPLGCIRRLSRKYLLPGSQ